MVARNSLRRAAASVWLTIAALGVCRLSAAQAPQHPTDPPAFTILYSGETRGHLESCGCGGRPAVGLAQRVGLLLHLRQQHPNSVVMDTGNLSAKADETGLILRAMRIAQYDALAAGELEHKLGETFWSLAGGTGQTVVALGPARSPGGALPKNTFVKDIGEKKVGLLSAYPSATPPQREELQNLLHGLRRSCDLVLLVSHDPLSQVQSQLRAELKGLPDLVLGPKGSESLPGPQLVEGAYVLPLAPRGQRIGLVKVWPGDAAGAVGGPRVRIEHSMVPVTAEAPAHAQVRELLESHFARSGQTASTRTAMSDSSLLELGYVTARRCGECHEQQLKAWKSSRHVQALATLKQKNRLLPECLRCHSTLYAQTQRLFPSASGPEGIECASCHGDGLVHTALGRKGFIQRPSASNCLTCHDQDNSPTYDAPSYWAKVKH